MRSHLVSSLLVAAVAAAPTIEPRTGATGYEGYKVLRMEAGGQFEKVKDMVMLEVFENATDISDGQGCWETWRKTGVLPDSAPTDTMLRRLLLPEIGC